MNDIRRDIDRTGTAAVLVDSHVHIHDCFDVATFLDGAAQNFAAAATGMGIGPAFTALLCLTETSRARKYDELRSGARAAGGDWQIRAGEEIESITAEHPELGRIHIVAGRQIVVDERLEVLALGFAAQRPDGGAMAEVIDEVTAAGALAVLPWGFGKWLGGRGRALRDVIERKHADTLFVGDNSGRPVGFGEPAEFALAARLGMRVLPGTDPLPFASETARAGSFGFACAARVGDATPWADLRAALVNPDVTLHRYGRLESPLRFVRNQVAMQYQVRTRRENP